MDGDLLFMIYRSNESSKSAENRALENRCEEVCEGPHSNE